MVVTSDHNIIGQSFRLGLWWSLNCDTRIIDIDSSSIRSAHKSYGKNRLPTTINRMKACLFSVFKYAVKECDYLQNNLVTRVSSLTEDNKIVRYLSDQERRTLINACKASDWNSLLTPYSASLTCSNKHSQREATSILTQGAMHRDFLWYFIPVLTTMPAMDKEYQCCV